MLDIVFMQFKFCPSLAQVLTIDKQEPRRRCYTIHGGDLMSDHINYGSDEQSKHAKQTYEPYYLPEQLAALSEKFLFFTFHT